MDAPARPARYRAPTRDGETLSVPPWTELGDFLAANQQWRAEHDFPILGTPLSQLTQQARAEITSPVGKSHVGKSLRDLQSPAPWIVTGHQPGLIHPGVWVKNFAAATLAAAHGGAALHIVIDADLCRTPAILVPAGTLDAPRLASVEFDGLAPALPWEERPVIDPALWRSFPERVHDAAGSLLAEPLLDQWWPTATAHVESTGLIGAALAQARHDVERELDCRTLELSQSRLCQTAAFRRFACLLLADLPRFAAAYNGTLADYRAAHHLRNHAHPVPNLAADGAWREAPFWIWTTQDPRRRPLFVRPADGGLLLTDRGAFERRLPLIGAGDAADADAAIETLDRWEAEGVKLRSRALITTLFTRLVVADLFLHGIGGAKYDEATDEIARRYFGAAPPAFAAISGTLRLPIAHAPADPLEPALLQHSLRDLTYHPERFFDAATITNGAVRRAADLVAEKSHWVRTPKSPANAAQRHRAIVAANAAMQPLVAAHRASIADQLASAEAARRASRVLDSREFAFCLFPRQQLEKFLLDFSERLG